MDNNKRLDNAENNLDASSSGSSLTSFKGVEKPLRDPYEIRKKQNQEKKYLFIF